MSQRQVDAYRFTGRTIGKLIKAQIDAATPLADTPWATVSKPLAESTVALLTTAGISMRDDEPFDMETETVRGNWGDPTWRRIDAGATSTDIAVNHLHIDTRYIERDINVALPLQRLRALADEGVVGRPAPNHYSIMGFQGDDSSTLENVSGPEIAASMQQDGVDLALLAPV